MIFRHPTEVAPKDAVPGVVASIQTFGSYANFHPHVHALVTEGVFARDGAFHAVAWPPSGVLEEVFRRLLLTALTVAWTWPRRPIRARARPA